MTVDVRDDRVRELIDENVRVEQLGTGFTFTEGPIWNPDGEYLLFSDMPADVRRRWDAAGGARPAATPCNKSNGMTLDRERRLVVCEHATSVVALMDPDGTGAGREVIASHWDGKELNSPNDVCVAGDGSIYFSDPPYGRSAGYGVEREQELDFQGVFRIAPDGELQLLADDFAGPNGLCFSPDESLLYVNDSPRGHIRVFEVAADGGISGGRLFAEGVSGPTGGVDGMKCDEHGDVWVTGPDGIWIFAADGTHLGVLRIPERCANLHWGGPGWSQLFVTASTSLYRVQTRTRGRREPFMGAS
jgi:gluconolactonase